MTNRFPLLAACAALAAAPNFAHAQTGAPTMPPAPAGASPAMPAATNNAPTAMPGTSGNAPTAMPGDTHNAPAPMPGTPANAPAPGASPTMTPPVPGAPPIEMTEPPHPLATIDPAARDLITQMVAAQKALHSYVVGIDMADTTSGTVIPESVMHGVVTFDAPAKAAVTITRGNDVLGQFFSDGVYFYGVSTAQKRYGKNKLPTGAAAQLVTAQIGRVGLLAQTFANPDGLNGLLTAPSLTTVTKSPLADTLSGTPVDTVIATLSDPNGRGASFTFAIGQADHIIRRVIIQQQAVPASTPPGGAPQAPPTPATTHTETVTLLNLNPTLPASQFTFTPPAGFTLTAPPSAPGGMAPPKAVKAPKKSVTVKKTTAVKKSTMPKKPAASKKPVDTVVAVPKKPAAKKPAH